MEITGLENGKVMGNLYPLDYEKHFQHVRDSSLPSDTVKLVYEHGEQIQKAGQPIHPEKETPFGKFLRFENVPNDPEKLDSLLYEERRSRAAMRPGSIEQHNKRLTGRTRKPSIRSQKAYRPDKKAIHPLTTESGTGEKAACKTGCQKQKQRFGGIGT